MSRGPTSGIDRTRAVVRRIDSWTDGRLEPLRQNRLANRVFYTASEAGNFSVLWHAAAWLPCLVDPSREQIRRSARTSAALAVESVLVNGGVKSLFRRARPVYGSNSGPHRLRQPKTSSFPSGHATAAMVAAALLSQGRSRWVSGAAYTTAAVVSVSRVHVRIHHASDVMGGLAMGWVFGVMFRRLLQ